MSELDDRLTDKDDVDAIMSALSYEYAQDPDRVDEYLRYGHLQGWRVDDDLSNMKETIFVNPETKQVVFSSKGTNPGHFEDLISDGQLTVTPFKEWKKFSRFGKSLEAFDRVRTKYGDEYGYKTVGHSLGGGVALTIADQRGVPSTVFNPSLPFTQAAANVSIPQSRIIRTRGDTVSRGRTAIVDGERVTIGTKDGSWDPLKSHAMTHFLNDRYEKGIADPFNLRDIDDERPTAVRFQEDTSELGKSLMGDFSML